MMEGVRKNCEKAVAGVPGVLNVTAVLTEARQKSETPPEKPAAEEKLGAEGVDAIIAVAMIVKWFGSEIVEVSLE